MTRAGKGVRRAEGAWGAERAPMRGAEPDSGSEGGWSGDEGGEEEVWEEVAAGEEAVTEDDKVGRRGCAVLGLQE